MKNLNERIREVLESISIGTDGFEFAGIIEREDADGRWDLVVAATWIPSEFEFLKVIAPELTKVLADNELFGFRQIVVLDPNGEFMQSFNQLIGPVAEDRDLFNITIGGIPVRHAHVFAVNSNSFAPA